MKILFICSHRLGDTVISTALLSALLVRYPTAIFTIVCSPDNASLFEAFPRCERLIVMEKRKHNRHWVKLWGQVILTRWFMVVDLRSSIISLALWCRKRFLVKGGRKPGLKIAQQAHALGFQKIVFPRVWLREETLEKAHILFTSKDKWLALAPTAGTAYKMWPAENFIQIGRRFLALGYKIIVLYGSGEAERKAALPLLMNLPCHDYGKGKVLSDVAACLSCCSLFIGNDSGLMHLAGAMGVPTLGLFGPSKASQYAPSGRFAMALSAPGKEGEGDMTALSVDKVFCSAGLLLKQAYERPIPFQGNKGASFYAL